MSSVLLIDVKRHGVEQITQVASSGLCSRLAGTNINGVVCRICAESHCQSSYREGIGFHPWKKVRRAGVVVERCPTSSAGVGETDPAISSASVDARTIWANDYSGNASAYIRKAISLPVGNHRGTKRHPVQACWALHKSCRTEELSCSLMPLD